MGKGAREVKVAALLVGLAALAVAAPLAEPLWWWAMTKRVAYSGTSSVPIPDAMAADRDSALPRMPELRGFRMVKRLSPSESHGRTRAWYVESGQLALELLYEDGRWVRKSYWSLDGAVFCQISRYRTSAEDRSEPPWWWGVKDQTHPTAPWWKAEGR